MNDLAAGGSGGSRQPDHQQRSGGGAAAAEAVPSAVAQWQESPQFVGLSSSRSAVRPWCAQARINGKQYYLGRCVTRAEAAASHDLGLIWKRLHGKGARNAMGASMNSYFNVL